MSTGAISVILAKIPFRFQGLTIIGKSFFILDLVLFSVFVIIISIRFQRTGALSKSLQTPPEALFFGSLWVSIALLLNCIQAYGVPVCGLWLVKTLEVCFWIYSTCALCVAIVQYGTIFVGQRMPISSAIPAWIFPAYPFLVIGPLAGTLLPSQPAAAALPIFIGAVAFQSLGWLITIFMYTIYITRLLTSDLPPASTRPGMLISVGPAGYTSTGLVALGRQAPSVIPSAFLGVETLPVGDVVKILFIMAGMSLWLVSFWFFALSIIAIGTGIRQMRFTLNWWAFVFPNAGMCLATIELGQALNSSAIKGVSCAMAVLLIVAWLVIMVLNIIAVRKRNLLWEGMDDDHGVTVSAD
ncbi:uncharacterized protein A1O9_08643 [Exophiala aquamarina CBS 119918]|uniref:Malic acid transport protein n=1 Tax=Exophiala aquamarina CBS 119918 TaxID=1182545 RepID=A0A072P549_9EURO|nr:uncharacterized protein A1O9_08643 [Exophiala aquamarina CBS 119918]KEF54991.1 hypothetical protein A1O9_08643 [Exophiala aquamarina CBS 119918]